MSRSFSLLHGLNQPFLTRLQNEIRFLFGYAVRVATRLFLSQDANCLPSYLVGSRPFSRLMQHVREEELPSTRLCVDVNSLCQHLVY
jgi:hypothetical protein